MYPKWTHMSDLPDGIRTGLGAIFFKWDIKDLRFDSALGLMVESDDTRKRLSEVLRQSSNSWRIPLMCNELRVLFPDMSARKTFTAVGLFLGLSPRHIARVYYGVNRCFPSK